MWRSVFICALCCWPAIVGASSARNGEAILKMCKGAERVRALSVMCHNYLNGFLDASSYASRHGGKRMAQFCLEPGDKERMPAELVAWMHAHPEALQQEAGEALQRMLGERFRCARK